MPKDVRLTLLAAGWLMALFALSLPAPRASIASGAQITPTPLPDSDLHCGTLGVVVDNQPVFDGAHICPEYLVPDLLEGQPSGGLAAITSIAYAPSCDQMDTPRLWCGALFFVRPDAGMLLWVGAYHRDRRTYDLNTFASGLTIPNGLAWHDDAWYVAGGPNIYRLADENNDGQADAIEIIVDSLPGNGGFWTNSIAFGPDGRMYLSKGASCNACLEADPRRASILSYNPDGTGEQVFASGLRNTFDFTWHPTDNAMWVTNEGRDDLGEMVSTSMLYRIADSGMHFGWPDCPPENCEGSPGSAAEFPPQSNPAGLVVYHGSAFPEWAGDLLVVLRGSTSRRMPSGYALVRLCLDPASTVEPCLDRDGVPLLNAAGQPILQEVLVPSDPFHGLGIEDLHIQGQSFYPDHPVDIAISPEGWIAISVLEGRIIRLRPSE